MVSMLISFLIFTNFSFQLLIISFETDFMVFSYGRSRSRNCVISLRVEWKFIFFGIIILIQNVLSRSYILIIISFIMRVTLKEKRKGEQEQGKERDFYGLNKLLEMSSTPINTTLAQTYLTQNVPQEYDELIDIDTKYHFSFCVSQSTNQNELKQFIKNIIKKHNIIYSKQFGYICTHVMNYYKNNRKRLGKETVGNLMDFIIDKYEFCFRFERKKDILKEKDNEGKGFLSREDIMAYGKLCALDVFEGKFEAWKDFLQEDLHSKKHIKAKQSFLNLIQRYLSSLFLEYIPSDYSQLLLNLLLETSHPFTQLQQEHLQKTRQSHQQIYPYHTFFLIFTSLISYICFKREPYSFEHFIDICQKCFMGNVQWPVVLANRCFMMLPERRAKSVRRELFFG